MNQPRRHIYHFAHVQLRNDAHRYPEETWRMLTGPDWSDYLAMQWTLAKSAGPPEVPIQGLGVEGVEQRGAWEVLFLRMPRPEGMTEPYFVAFARRPERPAEVGYFVMERGADEGGQERAFVGEWRLGGRINQGTLPAVTLDAFREHLDRVLAGQGTPAFPPLGDAIPAGNRPAGPQPGSLQPGGPLPLGQQPPGQQPARGQAAPAKGGSGLKVFLAVAGLFALFIAYRVVRAQLSMREWRARREATLAQEGAAQQRGEQAKKAAEAKIEALKAAAAACTAREQKAVADVAAKVFPGGKVAAPAVLPPKDKERLVGSPVAGFPEGGKPSPPSTVWLPESRWLGKAASACPTEAQATIKALQQKLGEKPERYASGYPEKLEAWASSLDQMLAGLEQAPPKTDAPPAKSVAFVSDGCEARAVERYQGFVGGFHEVTLNSYTCKPKIVWAAVPEGQVLAVASGDGSAQPTVNPGERVEATRLATINDASRESARSKAAAKLASQLALWGGK